MMISRKSIDKLKIELAREFRLAPGMFSELQRIEELLAETYRNRIQYELLQNSDDAGSRSVSIQIFEDGSVKWKNDGRRFTESDISALCRSASSNKKRGESIGYRGIGFKSLAAVARRVTVASAGISFSFDRSKAAHYLSCGGQKVLPSEIPLIRIPVEIRESIECEGAEFYIEPNSDESVVGIVEPVDLLFLRSVSILSMSSSSGERIISREEYGNTVRIFSSVGEAKFGMIRTGQVEVAIPINEVASSLVGLQGRLFSFLPLADQVGMPFVINGDFLTDPSRTNLVLGDQNSMQLLREAAEAIAAILADPKHSYFSRCWNLLLEGQDLRTFLTQNPKSPLEFFICSLRESMLGRKVPFSWIPVPLRLEEVEILFPNGAPSAFYLESNKRAAKALQLSLGIGKADIGELLSPQLNRLSPETIGYAAEYVQELARARGVRPNSSDQVIIDFHASRQETAMIDSRLTGGHHSETCSGQDGTAEFSQVFMKWRTAEIAACEWLNSRGWNLDDVSKQNLGYDLSGTRPNGEAVMIEIKKVNRLNDPFAMTNNEMGIARVSEGEYLVGVVLGEGRGVRFGFLDPNNPSIPIDRVCRAWEWRISNWESYLKANLE